MAGQLTTWRNQPQLRLLLGALCIALLLVGGIVSVAHSHPDGSTTHQDCGLCVAAHMAIQVAVLVTLVSVTNVFTRVETSSPVASLQFIAQFALFSRPPPADSDRS